MREELLHHIKHCSECHKYLRHVFIITLVAHLVSQRFTEKDAHHAIRVIYSNLRRTLRETEARS